MTLLPFPHERKRVAGRGGGWGILTQTPHQKRRDPRVPQARGMNREPTEAERVLWQHLRHLSVHGSHFRRQATIGPYFADFACHHARLMIDVNGGQHNDDDRIARDARRTADLIPRGYRVLRFWNNDVFSNIEGVMET